jgi:peptidoglycan/xylan/chitin deacetylase (PgdA/CDA1 family)
MHDPTNRRRFLTAVGVGTFALAGCTDRLSGDDDEEEDAEDGDDEEDAQLDDGEDDEEEEDEEEEEEVAAPPAIDHGELVDDFEELDDWFALEGEVTADEEEALTGTQSPRIEGEGASAGIARAYPDGLDVEGHHLSLAVRVDTPRPTGVTVRLLAPGQADQLWSTRTVLGSYEGWLRMDVGYTGQRGEPNLENVQELQIAIETQDEEGIRFWVDDLRATPQADQGYVMLTFDDNVESQYTDAFPIFEERGMQGVLAVIPPTLNRPERLHVDQLREMRDAGWDVSVHAERSDGLAEMDPEEAREALESDQEYLDDRGFSDGARSHFVPFHNVDQEVVDIVREYYELNSYFGGTPNAVPFTDPMHLSRVDMHDADGFSSMIDMAAEHNQLAIGLAHGVVPEAEIEDDPLADMTTEQLEGLLDYIEESDVQLVTASQLLDNQDDL